MLYIAREMWYVSENGTLQQVVSESENNSRQEHFFVLGRNCYTLLIHFGFGIFGDAKAVMRGRKSKLPRLPR